MSIAESLKALQESLKTSRERQGAQDVLGARNALEGGLEQAAALADVEATEEERHKLMQFWTALHGEMALLLQRANDVRGALQQHLAALERARELSPTDAQTPLQLATVLINITALYAREKMIDEGLEASAEAVSSLQAVTGPMEATARMLLVGALHNRSSLFIESRRLAEAEENLAEALRVGELVLGQPQGEQLLAQVVDAGARLSQVRAQQNKLPEALRAAEQALALTKKPYEGGTPQARQMYVNVRMLLLDLSFVTGKYAVGEDHLYEAIEGSGGAPQILVVGSGYYLSLLRMDDARLQAGNLPRPEVIESLEDVLDRIEQLNPPALLKDVLRARFAVMAHGDLQTGHTVLEAVDRAIAENKLEAQDPVHQLHPLLREDVAYLERGKNPDA